MINIIFLIFVVAVLYVLRQPGRVGEDGDRLGEDEQDEMLQAMGAEAARLGYRGLVLTTDAGRPVGRWLGLRGAARIEEREDPPPQTQSPAADPVERAATQSP